MSTSASPIEVTIRQLKSYSVPTNTPADAVMSDGTKFYGELRPHDKVPHGKGYAFLADGSKYGGEWRDGKFHGKGAMITDTYEYEGSWDVGRMHGMGTMLYKDSVFSSVMHGIASITPFEQRHRPLEYRGEFHRVHHRHGKGTMLYRSGDRYEGEWCANQRDGCGTMLFENGEKYVGFWAKDERNGTGTMTYNDGTIFTGEMINDERNGQGTLRFPNGDVYEGTFQHDQMEGMGIMRYRNGDVYTGMWRDGIRHGHGEFLLKRTGATITGNFYKGLIQGRGCVCVLPGRSYFRGEYSKGERIRGTCWMSDGSCYDGEWAGDNMSGRGLMWYPNGDFYYGSFQRSKRHGRGCLNIAADGTEYAGEFIEDKWCGVGMRQDRDGNIAAGTFGSPVGGAQASSATASPSSSSMNSAALSTRMLPATRGIPKLPAGGVGGDNNATTTPASSTNGGVGNEFSPPPSLLSPQRDPASSQPPPFPSQPDPSSYSSDATATEAAEVFPLLHGYSGEWNGTTFSGIGHLYLPSGDHFFGIFHNGFRHGAGCMTRSVNQKEKERGDRGDKLAAANALRTPLRTTGRWIRDSLCGYGTVRFANGTLYQGYWEDGMRHGHGQFRAADGTIYNGGWQHDVQKGEGCLFLINEKEPIYSYPAGSVVGGEAGGKGGDGGGVAGIFGSVLTLFSSGPREIKPKPILLGYEDLCAVHGHWAADGVDEVSKGLGIDKKSAKTNGSGADGGVAAGLLAQHQQGKLYGTVTVFFADVFEKIYQGEWAGNRQLIDFPHKLRSAEVRGRGRAAVTGAEGGGERGNTHDVKEVSPAFSPGEDFAADQAQQAPGGTLDKGYYKEENTKSVASGDISLSTAEGNSSSSAAAAVSATPSTANALVQRAYAQAVATSNNTNTNCTFCLAPFGFFKKESFCSGCQRVSCPSCLLDAQVSLLNKSKSLPHPAVNGGLVGTVELCRECVECVKKGVVYATQWFTFKRKGISHSSLSTARARSSLLQEGAEVATSSSSPASPTLICAQEVPLSAAEPLATLVDLCCATTTTEGNSNGGVTTAPTAQITPTLGLVSISPSRSPITATEDAAYPSTQQTLEYQVYQGYFAEGNVPQGVGTLWRNEDAYYRGDFRGGKRAGQGSVVFINGEEYFGGWEDNKPHGVGVYRCNDGTAIEAEWHGGKVRRLRYHGEINPKGYERHGTGVAVYTDGTRYNGEWSYNSRHGTGLVQYSNGTIYSGQFAHDNQHGIGKIVNSESVFMGEFNEGAKHGVGVLVVGRRTLKGTWTDDVLNGWVRIWNDDSCEIIDTLYASDEERSDVFIIGTHQEDEAVSQCPGCKSSFGFFLRRHHCRLCGGVFCDSCSKARMVIPSYFNTGDGPQRTCNKCRTSLVAGCTLAVKRYRDGGVYVGQWSQGRWAGRGLYRSPNGHMAIVLSKPPGGSLGQCFSRDHGAEIAAKISKSAATTPRQGANLHEDLNIVEDLRHTLGDLPPASESDIVAFRVWWDRIVSGVGQPYTFDFTPYAEIPPPTASLPFEIRVFSEYTPGCRSGRDLAAADARRKRFVPPTIPPMPHAPWYLKPVRPRKICEPSEEDVMVSIRAERIRGLAHVSEPNVFANDGARAEAPHSSSDAAEDTSLMMSSVPRGFYSADESPVLAEDPSRACKEKRHHQATTIAAARSLRRQSLCGAPPEDNSGEQQGEEEEDAKEPIVEMPSSTSQQNPPPTDSAVSDHSSFFNGGASTDASSHHGAAATTAEPSTVKTVGDLRRKEREDNERNDEGGEGDNNGSASSNVAANTAIASQVVMTRNRINLPTPPIPARDNDTTALSWPVWEPKPAHQYKGVASAPGGEVLAPRGGISSFLSEGLGSGPIIFNDVPQKFKVIWSSRRGGGGGVGLAPEVAQEDRAPDDMFPEPLPPLPTTTAIPSCVAPLEDNTTTTTTTTYEATYTPQVGPFTPSAESNVDGNGHPHSSAPPLALHMVGADEGGGGQPQNPNDKNHYDSRDEERELDDSAQTNNSATTFERAIGETPSALHFVVPFCPASDVAPRRQSLIHTDEASAGYHTAHPSTTYHHTNDNHHVVSADNTLASSSLSTSFSSTSSNSQKENSLDEETVETVRVGGTMDMVGEGPETIDSNSSSAALAHPLPHHPSEEKEERDSTEYRRNVPCNKRDTPVSEEGTVEGRVDEHQHNNGDEAASGAGDEVVSNSDINGADDNDKKVHITHRGAANAEGEGKGEDNEEEEKEDNENDSQHTENDEEDEELLVPSAAAVTAAPLFTMAAPAEEHTSTDAHVPRTTSDVDNDDDEPLNEVDITEAASPEQEEGHAATEEEEENNYKKDVIADDFTPLTPHPLDAIGTTTTTTIISRIDIDIDIGTDNSSDKTGRNPSRGEDKVKDTCATVAEEEKEKEKKESAVDIITQADAIPAQLKEEGSISSHCYAEEQEEEEKREEEDAQYDEAEDAEEEREEEESSSSAGGAHTGENNNINENEKQIIEASSVSSSLEEKEQEEINPEKEEEEEEKEENIKVDQEDTADLLCESVDADAEDSHNVDVPTGTGTTANEEECPAATDESAEEQKQQQQQQQEY